MKEKSSGKASLDYAAIIKDSVSTMVNIWNMKPQSDLSTTHVVLSVIGLILTIVFHFVTYLVDKKRSNKVQACTDTSNPKNTTVSGVDVNCEAKDAIGVCDEELKKESLENANRKVMESSRKDMIKTKRKSHCQS